VGVSIPDDLQYPDFAAMLIDGGSNREGATQVSFMFVNKVINMSSSLAGHQTMTLWKTSEHAL
jgi:hypothetical protein